jgi:hypothetical protein
MDTATATAKPNGYGTVSQSASSSNPGTGQDSADTENASLLGNNKKADGQPLTIRMRKHFAANVSRSWADLALLGCYVITGLLDSSSVFIWGSFVSMQTGKPSPLPIPSTIY